MQISLHTPWQVTQQPFGLRVIPDEFSRCHPMKPTMWLDEMVGQTSCFPARQSRLGRTGQSRCSAKNSLFLSMILRVGISTGVLCWWQCRAAQKQQLPLNISSLEEYELWQCIAEAGEHPANSSSLYSTANCSKSPSTWLFKEVYQAGLNSAVQKQCNTQTSGYRGITLPSHNELYHIIVT